MVPNQVSIPAGVSEVLLNIAIFNDDFQEDTESFTVAIEIIPGVTPLGVKIGTPNLATVEIIDADGK